MRIQLLQHVLGKENLDAFLVSGPSNIFYLTGLSQFIHPGDAYFLVTQKKSYLLTSALYADGVPQTASFETRVISHETPLTHLMNEIVRHGRVEQLGIESEHVSLSLFSHLEKKIEASLLPTHGVVEQLRISKDAHELRSIRRACQLTDDAFAAIAKKVRRGVTERELAFEIELFISTRGGRLAFPVIAAFGAHGATPHHENSDTKLHKSHGVILLDFGAKVDGYCSDLSRCIFVEAPTSAVASTYDSLVAIQKKTIAYAQKQPLSTPLSNIAQFCDGQLAKESLPPFPHSLGHGLGIDIHEAPRVSSASDDVLKNGMVFTIEPGVYVPGTLGMRIEDTVGIVENKLRQFTHAPKDKVVISI